MQRTIVADADAVEILNRILASTWRETIPAVIALGFPARYPSYTELRRAVFASTTDQRRELRLILACVRPLTPGASPRIAA